MTDFPQRIVRDVSAMACSLVILDSLYLGVADHTAQRQLPATDSLKIISYKTDKKKMITKYPIQS